jgi:hypothetical protein
MSNRDVGASVASTTPAPPLPFAVWVRETARQFWRKVGEVATEAVRKALGVTGDCAGPECCQEAAWAERAALAADMAACADERCRRAAERWPALAGWR